LRLISALIALAAVAMLAAGLRSAQGANSASYTDPTGDYQGGSPDITGASISNDDSGVVTVVVQFAAGRPLVSGMNAGIYYDTDNNQGSGSPTGSEYEIEVDVGANTWAYYRWNGSAWEHVTSSTGNVTFNDTSATFTINRSELGNTSRLNFWVFGNWAANDATDYDFAPGSGAFGPYDVILAAATTTTTTTTSVTPPPATTTTPTTTTTLPPSGATVAGVDTDKDGLADASDKCPKTRGGSYDKNKNGCPGPFSAIRVPTGDDLRPSISSGGITKYASPRNAIKRLPAGAQVLLRFGSQRERLTADKTGTARSQLLLRNAFKNNSQVEIWAWKPGWIGFGVRLVVRTSSPFAVVTNRRCIAPTASTPRPCNKVSRGG
jgi:hypothetical protein